MIRVRDYAVVTAAYWAFTLTDGALRLLVLLHFHDLGYTPVQLAFLFLLYEFFGILTNLFGGWLAARTGIRLTLVIGLVLQIAALALLAMLNPAWSVGASVAWAMGCQALSGIAKDLTKMSAKSAVKVLVPRGDDSGLFKWVAFLTGSKNALKGIGFFLGGLLLAELGFFRALVTMLAALLVVLGAVLLTLTGSMGRANAKPRFRGILTHSQGINRLSIARFALFAARDVWFVVSVPIFMASTLGWTFTEIGTFLAMWVIGYGVVQGISPALLARFTNGRAPTRAAASGLAFSLAAATAAIPLGLHGSYAPEIAVLGGLGLFGVMFALNSSVHSYLVLAYSETDRVAMNVGFYYMANAAGRLAGTLLSGVLYQSSGVVATLWASVLLSALAGVAAMFLPPVPAAGNWDAVSGDE